MPSSSVDILQKRRGLVACGVFSFWGIGSPFERVLLDATGTPITSGTSLARGSDARLPEIVKNGLPVGHFGRES